MVDPRAADAPRAAMADATMEQSASRPWSAASIDGGFLHGGSPQAAARPVLVRSHMPRSCVTPLTVFLGRQRGVSSVDGLPEVALAVARLWGAVAEPDGLAVAETGYRQMHLRISKAMQRDER